LKEALATRHLVQNAQKENWSERNRVLFASACSGLM
jgi:hypothetical protein